MSVATRRERERQQRREAILAAACRVLEAHGVEGTTIDRVAAEADLSKGTVYLYFDSKEALLLEVATDTMHRLYCAAEQVGRSGVPVDIRLREALRAVATFMSDEMARCQVVVSVFRAMPYPAKEEDKGLSYTFFRQELHNLQLEIGALVDAGKKTGVIRADVDQGVFFWQAIPALAGVAYITGGGTRALAAVDLLMRSVCVEEPAPATLQASA